MYFLDKDNFELLLDSLGITMKDNIINHLKDVFGKNFDSNKFEDFCNEKKYNIRKY